MLTMLSVGRNNKKKFNLSMPPELAELFEASAAGFGDKRRWRACAGAVYLWLKLPEGERAKLAKKMFFADNDPEDMEKLLASLKKRKRRVGRAKASPLIEEPGLPGSNGGPASNPGTHGKGDPPSTPLLPAPPRKAGPRPPRPAKAR